MTKGTTAARLWPLPVSQDKVPSLICTTSIKANIRNTHPETEPRPETNIPTRTRPLLTKPRKWGKSELLDLERRMACLRLKAMRLENKKELKEYTWKAIMSSAMCGSGLQAASEMRELLGSLGFQVRPRKTASVKSEFTFTMPSSAVM